MSVARVCATAAHTNAHITTNTPAIHAPHRFIVFVLSESVRVFVMVRILARRRKGATRVFDGPSRRHAELDRSPGKRVGHHRRPLRQKLARLRPPTAE
jgi:hypothetical protein